MLQSSYYWARTASFQDFRSFLLLVLVFLYIQAYNALHVI